MILYVIAAVAGIVLGLFLTGIVLVLLAARWSGLDQ